MDRRSFIHRGTVGATGLAAGTTGCATGLPGPSTAGDPPDPVAQFVRQFDVGTRRLDAWSISQDLPDSPADVATLDDLGRTSVKALYVTGLFGDLDVQHQLHPQVQERIWSVQPALDDAVLGVDALLRAQTAAEHASLRQRLRQRPELVTQFVDLIDRQAAESGLSERRRQQFRGQADHVAWRLANQPPELLIDEYIAKVEKVSALDVEALAEERWLTARIGEAAFWQEQEGLRERRISRGLRTMGIGGIILGVSGILLFIAAGGDREIGALAAVGAVGGTVGSIFLLIGLVRVLMGLSTSPDTP